MVFNTGLNVEQRPHVAEWWSTLAVSKELSTFLMGVVLKRFGAYGCILLTSL